MKKFIFCLLMGGFLIGQIQGQSTFVPTKEPVKSPFINKEEYNLDAVNGKIMPIQRKKERNFTIMDAALIGVCFGNVLMGSALVVGAPIVAAIKLGLYMAGE